MYLRFLPAGNSIPGGCYGLIVFSPLDWRRCLDSLPINWRQSQPRVLVVVGTRPEVIKLGPVVKELERDPDIHVSLCVVAQQTDLLEQAVAEWNLVVDYRVSIPRSDHRLAATLAAMLPGLADAIEAEKPSLVMVEGDTTTNLGAALAAFYAGVPVAHVEAGLRSGDPHQPFPEEMHRVLVDQLASIHYAPTDGARDNLLAERSGGEESVLVSGNTVVDALLSAMRDNRDLSVLLPQERRVLLVTAHRRENFGDGIEQICRAVRQLATSRDDLDVVFVLHSNPAARAPAEAALGDLANVRLIAPQPYHAFIRLIARADIVLTDSGGVQEEAPYLGTPVLVAREVTERPEASAAGAAQLVGTCTEAIVDAVSALLDNAELYAAMSQRVAPYGDGDAAVRIHDDLVKRLVDPSPYGLAASTEVPVVDEPGGLAETTMRSAAAQAS
jgi:UDP-N-acetylglucosamine 2-epimerase (non-hydrolysing)